jgi:3-hydroxybutyryl-CoA dehydrogenase
METIKSVAIIGAGTMGRGIAAISAQAGYITTLVDVNEITVQQAEVHNSKNWDMLLEKGKITAAQRSEFNQNIKYTNDIMFASADLIIEAIVEKIEIKQSLFKQLEGINTPSTIFASNTSSLSITAIASALTHPERFAGLHFFNPAPVMKLVELVKATHTSNSTLDSLKTFANSLGKTVVTTGDSPGFIVNRVARHFYLESLKIAEEQGASIESIDALMESVGFKMGPFKLMDLIGNDINYSVTKSLFDAFHFDPKFRPSRLQEQKVIANQLGRKTHVGFYTYDKSQ